MNLKMKIKKKQVFISWTVDSTRSDSLAYHLGANCYHIHYFKLSRLRMLYAPLKYVLASFKTVSILNKERPEVILVQNPPPFAILVVWLYCLFSNAVFITDSHTGAFDRWRWKQFLWLYRFLAKRALVNIIHNKPLEQLVAEWGVPTITIGDIPFHLKTDIEYPFGEGFNVVVICSYDDDEPIEEVLKAAKRLPLINFYITGNLKVAPKDLSLKISSNVILTDFIPHKEYVALVKGCDVVVCLTKQNFTMQNGAYEAIELERPVVTSNWPVLRETLSKGTIHIDNTADSLVRALEQIRDNYSYYLNEIKILRSERRVVWEKSFSMLLKLIGYEEEKGVHEGVTNG